MSYFPVAGPDVNFKHLSSLNQFLNITKIRKSMLQYAKVSDITNLHQKYWKMQGFYEAPFQSKLKGFMGDNVSEVHWKERHFTW